MRTVEPMSGVVGDGYRKQSQGTSERPSGGDQYSSGNSTVVTERSHSVMTHILTFSPSE